MKKILVLLFAILLASCGHNAWTKRGYKKGWIKDSIVKIDTVIQSDTLRDSIEVEKVLMKYDTLLFNLCDSLGRVDTVKAYIYREKIRKEFVYLQGNTDTLKHFTKDIDVIVYKRNGKWYIHADCVQQEVKPVIKEKNNWMLFWVGFICGMLLIIIIKQILK